MVQKTRAIFRNKISDSRAEKMVKVLTEETLYAQGYDEVNVRVYRVERGTDE